MKHCKIIASSTAPTERKANLAAIELQEHHKEIANDTANYMLKEAIEKYIDIVTDGRIFISINDCKSGY